MLFRCTFCEPLSSIVKGLVYVEGGTREAIREYCATFKRRNEIVTIERVNSKSTPYNLHRL